MTLPVLTCTRCRRVCWPVDPHTPFVCHHCRAVLSGKNAVDPLGSEAERDTLARARVRRSYKLGAAL